MKNGDLPAMPIVMVTEQSQYNGNTYAEVKQSYDGLTKRERFAMAAMQGILSNGVDFTLHEDKDVAKAAIIHADNLLAELERTK